MEGVGVLVLILQVERSGVRLVLGIASLVRNIFTKW